MSSGSKAPRANRNAAPAPEETVIWKAFKLITPNGSDPKKLISNVEIIADFSVLDWPIAECEEVSIE